MEEGSFRNRAESIAKHFGTRPRARVALEAGAQSAWIARQLAKCGHEVIVANTRELKWITASDRKSDRGDAVKLAAAAVCIFSSPRLYLAEAAITTPGIY